MTFAQTFFSRQFLWEIVRILTVGTASLLYYFGLIPLPVLLVAIAFGLYSLVKVAAIDLVKERKIGTELFITVAVVVSVLGNKEFMQESNIALPTTSVNLTDTAIYLAADNKLAGVFYVSDAIREGAKEMIAGLKKSGITNIVMLTGDNPETAKHVSDQIGITEFRANLLPEDKINSIKELQKNGAKVAMVGDGINDAPALVQANIGIAMGAMGTEAAMEAADIVLMEDKLEKIARARAISKRAFRTTKENIFVGVGVVHVIGITLVLLRIIGPVQAAAIHLLPDTLVFINSIKLLRVKIQD